MFRLFDKAMVKLVNKYTDKGDLVKLNDAISKSIDIATIVRDDVEKVRQEVNKVRGDVETTQITNDIQSGKSSVDEVIEALGIVSKIKEELKEDIKDFNGRLLEIEKHQTTHVNTSISKIETDIKDLHFQIKDNVKDINDIRSVIEDIKMLKQMFSEQTKMTLKILDRLVELENKK